MHIKPKKRLGQNFLIDKNILRKIVSSCRLSRETAVLEIGAGKGELTEMIAQEAGEVYALEIDDRLIECLLERFSGQANIKIIYKDILKFNLQGYFKKLNKPLTIVGNIPYYISSAIIEHIIRSRALVDLAFLTVQKEFAQRLAACPGTKDYGSLSCFVQYYCEPKILFNISRNCFRPIPKVDSSFIRLKLRNVPPVKLNDVKVFFKIIRQSFNKRRKTLKSSLRQTINEEKLDEFFRLNNWDKFRRPETLSIQEFAALANYLKRTKMESTGTWYPPI